MAQSFAPGPVSILFVDDEPLMLQAFSRVVGSECPHWEVVTAAGVDQAKQELAKRRFSALVSDLVMPGPNGITLLAYAREHHPTMLRVVYSGVVEDFAHDRELRRADLVFTKPALATEVVSELERLLQPTGVPAAG
jgi:DNA-binding NtrC family response regulator